jgi:hypothetical protein
MEQFLDFDNKRMPYTVPDGFFEEMHQRLMETAPKSQPLVQPHRASRRLWMSVAAAAVFLIGVSFYALMENGKTEASLLADQSEGIEKYMTDEALDEWIAIYEDKDNTLL